MEINLPEIRAALCRSKEKDARKTLSDLADTLRRSDPETYRNILKRKNADGQCVAAYRRYRIANLISSAALLLTLIAVIGAYVLGDFSTAILTGWANRYLLAAVVLVAMGVLVLAGTYSSRRRAEYIATVLLSEDKDE